MIKPILLKKEDCKKLYFVHTAQNPEEVMHIQQALGKILKPFAILSPTPCPDDNPTAHWARLPFKIKDLSIQAHQPSWSKRGFKLDNKNIPELTALAKGFQAKQRKQSYLRNYSSIDIIGDHAIEALCTLNTPEALESILDLQVSWQGS